MVFGLVFVVPTNVSFERLLDRNDGIILKMQKDVSFLNKALLMKKLLKYFK